MATMMIYRSPGPHRLHEVDCEYKIVREEDVDGYLSDGWFKTPALAEAARSRGKTRGVRSGDTEKVKLDTVEEKPKKRRGRPPKVRTEES